MDLNRVNTEQPPVVLLGIVVVFKTTSICDPLGLSSGDDFKPLSNFKREFLTTNQKIEKIFNITLFCSCSNKNNFFSHIVNTKTFNSVVT